MNTSAERVEFDGLDGAYIQHTASGRTIETWGDEHPNLAIRTPSSGRRVLVHFDARDEAWAELARAVRRGERYEAHLAGRLSASVAHEKQINVHVFVARTTRGRILISLRPLDREDGEAQQVRLTPEAAEQLGIAMDEPDHRARRALVFDALREHTMEVVHERSR